MPMGAEDLMPPGFPTPGMGPGMPGFPGFPGSRSGTSQDHSNPGAFPRSICISGTVSVMVMLLLVALQSDSYGSIGMSTLRRDTVEAVLWL